LSLLRTLDRKYETDWLDIVLGTNVFLYWVFERSLARANPAASLGIKLAETVPS